MRQLLLIVIASCGGSAAPEQAPPQRVAAPANAEPLPWATGVPVVRASSGPVAEPTRERVTASPSGGINVVAITEDGGIAVTIDDMRSVRLWPNLDGSLEPVIVAMRTPAAIEVTRDGSEIAIAGLDDAGQLELVRTSARGDMAKRFAIDSARAFVAIRAVGSALVAQRDDGALVVFDLHGALRGELVADPGQHVATFATRNGRALAILDVEGKVRGRWIELEPLRWGPLTAVLPIRAERVALSPHHDRIAGVARNGKDLVIVGLEHGRVLARPIVGTFLESTLRPLGFLDNTTLALMSASTIHWWYNDLVSEAVAVSAAAVGDGVMVGGNSSALAIASPETNVEYVGYRVGVPRDLLALDDGFLITDGMSVAELDMHLRARKTHEMPRVADLRNGFYDTQILDAKHMIGIGYGSSGYAIYLVDLPTGKATPVTKDGYPNGYDRRTHLLTWAQRSSLELARFDPLTGTFGPTASFSVAQGTSAQVKLLSGTPDDAAIVTTSDRTSATITWVRLGDQEMVTTRAKHVSLTDEWWETNGDLRTLVDGRIVTVASPDGALVATLDRERMSLRAGSAERWTVPSAGAQQLVWTPSGELYAYGFGLAHVDRDTGRFDRRQCGWSFGRSAEPPRSVGNAALCEVE